MILLYADLFAQQAQVQIAHLSKGDTAGLASIQQAFIANNPGYDLAYLSSSREVKAQDLNKVIFVQEGEGTASIFSKGKQHGSELTVGDIVLLRKGEKMESATPFGLLVFTVPDAPEEDIPGFIRPD